MYKVLVVNDDGITSPGIEALVNALKDIATVYVAAPAEQQSGTARGISFREPIFVEEVDFEGAEVAYAVGGTPTDCVIWALSKFKGLVEFDYVVSGINMGQNSSSIAYYSATIAGALEGSVHGVRSIALSVDGHDTNNFEYICSLMPELLEMSAGLDPQVVLNVNAPDLEPQFVKGVRIAKMPPRERCPEFVFTGTERDSYYQMTAVLPESRPNLDEDLGCIVSGYASISPITARMFDPEGFKQMMKVTVNKDLFVIAGAQTETLTKVRKPEMFEENIAMLSKCIGRLYFPTILVKRYADGDLLESVGENSENAETVEIVDYNAFDSKEFASLAETIADRSVYIAGLETHIAIQQTAKEFLKRGYVVTVIEDCCSAGSKKAHKFAIDYLHDIGCRITTCEAVVKELAPEAF